MGGVVGEQDDLTEQAYYSHWMWSDPLTLLSVQPLLEGKKEKSEGFFGEGASTQVSKEGTIIESLSAEIEEDVLL